MSKALEAWQEEAIDLLEGEIYDAQRMAEKCREVETEMREKAEAYERAQKSYRAAIAALRTLAGKE